MLKKKTNVKNGKKRGKKKVFRKKVCKFCVDRISYIDYKDGSRLQRFVTEKGKMIAGKTSGNCSRHQRDLAKAIKRAREIAILPYAAA